MTLSNKSLLGPKARAALAADPRLGGGRLLEAAIEANPHPELAFLRSGRPLVNTAGQEQTEFSLLELDHLAQSWSVWYIEQGVRPRDRVAIHIDDSYAYSVHFFALSQIGAIPVLINSKAPQAVALGLCEKTTPVGLYTDRERLARLGADAHKSLGLRWTQLAEDLPAPPANALPDHRRFRHAPDDPVSIMHSSGTTGRPKAVTQTHASSVAGPRYRLVHFKEHPDYLMMPAQPQSHLGFIVYGTYALLGGTPIVPLFDPTGPELLAAIREHRPTAVMAFAHAYAELAALDLEKGALDSVRGWVTMGDAIHQAHLKRILANRSDDLPPAVFFDRFGTTELGWGLIVQPRTLSSKRSDRRVGKPDALAEVAVLRPDGRTADVGEIGLFGAKGPTITAGYWNDSDTTYRSKLGGYWLTGDMAFQDIDGNFYQVDRAVDAIHTPNGTGYSVLMEEVILSEVPSVLDCAVVAGREDDAMWPVAVVTCASGDVDPLQLLTSANEALRSNDYPELVLLEVAESSDDIPVGVTGKVLKSQLRERYSCLSAYVDVADAAAVASTLPVPAGAA